MSVEQSSVHDLNELPTTNQVRKELMNSGRAEIHNKRRAKHLRKRDEFIRAWQDKNIDMCTRLKLFGKILKGKDRSSYDLMSHEDKCQRVYDYVDRATATGNFYAVDTGFTVCRGVTTVDTDDGPKQLACIRTIWHRTA